jgi:hypothetical protein
MRERYNLTSFPTTGGGKSPNRVGEPTIDGSICIFAVVFHVHCSFQAAYRNAVSNEIRLSSALPGLPDGCSERERQRYRMYRRTLSGWDTLLIIMHLSTYGPRW